MFSQTTTSLFIVAAVWRCSMNPENGKNYLQHYSEALHNLECKTVDHILIEFQIFVEPEL